MSVDEKWLREIADAQLDSHNHPLDEPCSCIHCSLARAYLARCDDLDFVVKESDERAQMINDLEVKNRALLEERDVWRTDEGNARMAEMKARAQRDALLAVLEAIELYHERGWETADAALCGEKVLDAISAYRKLVPKETT